MDKNTLLRERETAMLKAKDIMKGEVISLKKDAPIFEAVELLAKIQHNWYSCRRR